MIEEPKAVKEGYIYLDEKNWEWCIKEDAPSWAVEEFNVFFCKAEPDENDLITLY